MIAHLLLVPTLLAAQPRWESAAPGLKPGSTATCAETATGDPALDEALRALSVTTGETALPLEGVRLMGLQALDEAAVWSLVGGKPQKIDGHGATVVVRRLVKTGLFAHVKPALDVVGGGVTLVVTVTEHPRVTRVVFEGLTELEPTPLLEAMLRAPKGRDRIVLPPPPPPVPTSAEPAPPPPPLPPPPWDVLRGGRCADPVPPRDWMARAEGNVVVPGIVWRGIPAALENLTEAVFGRGYRMASVQAELAPDGTLTVRVDEGRIERVVVSGVAPSIEAEVHRRLELRPGEVFVAGDLDAALRRVEAAFPFVRPAKEKRATRPRPWFVEETGADGKRVYRARDPEAPPAQRTWFTVEGRTVVIHLRANRYDGIVNPAEILRHTPATGFAPGLEVEGKIWDPTNRAHFTVDLAGNVNTRPASTVPGATGAGREAWRFDFLVGPRVQLPALRIAEVGVHGYSRVDTFDRWRIHRVDSYLYSLFFNRPDADYFRRQGLTAFATAHFAERFTCGVEYRRDRYHSLQRRDVWTVFNRDEGPPPGRVVGTADGGRITYPRPTTQGTMASVLLRLEWGTAPVAAHRVGGMGRDPEVSIVRRDAWWSELRTMNTLEIADPALGGDERFQFSRLVSDTVGFLRTGGKQGIKVRFRAAGKVAGDDLPVQKREALGGWTALRGYGFKELPDGDWSLLGTAEYRMHVLSAFVDVGSVRAGGDFGDAKTGVGLALNLGDEVHLDVAWRTDDRAEATPEVRFFFNRTY